MTAAELQEIILYPDFKTGLEELSSYLASIMQEAPIVHLPAKCLWQREHWYALERNDRHDLTVWTSGLLSEENQTNIEFKFNYETCAEKLDKELMNRGDNLRSAFENKQGNRAVVPGLYKDIVDRKPDMFVWIICARDLTNVSKEKLEWIPNGAPSKKYQGNHPYKTDRAFLDVVESFLKKMKKVRPFSVETAEIDTNEAFPWFFPSTYHFRICEFSQP